MEANPSRGAADYGGEIRGAIRPRRHRTADFHGRKIMSRVPGEVHRPAYGKRFEYTWDPGFASLSSVNISSWEETVPKTSLATFLSKSASHATQSAGARPRLKFPLPSRQGCRGPVLIFEWLWPRSRTLHSGNN